VKDYGIGIPKEKVSKVFDRFYRVNENETKSFPGLGLGLYISYAIVKRLGGNISVKSTLGKGSEFFVSIPLEKKL
jgi:two-component system CheB/CheR fusion protein